ncbi:hypothetical protein M8J75_007192 [Diaphorina citri]|nr:hypothetical protein M8J75_007192 [Diaphorina citri]
MLFIIVCLALALRPALCNSPPVWDYEWEEFKMSDNDRKQLGIDKLVDMCSGSPTLCESKIHDYIQNVHCGGNGVVVRVDCETVADLGTTKPVCFLRQKKYDAGEMGKRTVYECQFYESKGRIAIQERGTCEK